MSKRYNQREQRVRDTMLRYWTRPKGWIVRAIPNHLDKFPDGMVAADTTGCVYLYPNDPLSPPDLSNVIMKARPVLVGFGKMNDQILPLSEADVYHLNKIWWDKNGSQYAED